MLIIFSMLFFRFTFKDPNLAEHPTNLLETLKIVGPHRVYGPAFSNSRDPWHLLAPGHYQVSIGVVVRIVGGKSRFEALLNTVKDTVQVMLSELVIKKTGCQNVETLPFGMGKTIKR